MAEKIKVEPKPEYDARSVYFPNAGIPARIDMFAASLPDCNLSKVINAVMEQAIPQLEQKDFQRFRTQSITIEVTI